MFTVILFAGNSKSELIMALRTRSLDSFTVVSGKPTKLNAGSPFDKCTSIVTSGAATPKLARV
ncbi:hypothetical protein GPAL_0652 [Glaciecola pallidula DSM 14239 = ACAM 615]|uniref:Uncharacterized protein n=1 Tax=Brumicola pallidula DSM 14239 = ACAM 615 TaxID=1121922 RepID=K6ZAZ0_9ALTE|nr:hypothetical protein GPAL_0652 [Glaciecola pallidula DSM 14239 = ACAM 615]